MVINISSLGIPLSLIASLTAVSVPERKTFQMRVLTLKPLSSTYRKIVRYRYDDSHSVLSLTESTQEHPGVYLESRQQPIFDNMSYIRRSEGTSACMVG